MSSCHSHFERSMKRILTDRCEKAVLSPLLQQFQIAEPSVFS
jgi:hypothetical protein